MAMLLEYSVRSGAVNPDDSIFFSPCSNNGRKDADVHELFHFHLNFDGTFNLGSREFYDDVSSTSTPNVVRSSELQQRQDYDTDDSGFCDGLMSDTDILQMSNLRLGDESLCENTTNSCQFNTFPLPKLCLLSQFDEYCENEAKPVADSPPTSYEHCVTERGKTEAVDVLPSERVSVRRQRSPDAVVERCSRHRLSLDSFSESRSKDRRPVRRSSDSFALPNHSTDNGFSVTSPHRSPDDQLRSVWPPPASDNPLQANLPPPALSDPLQGNLSPPLVAEESLSRISSPVSVLHEKPLHNNQLLEPPPVVDQLFNPTPVEDSVFNDQLQLVLSKFAPPCLNQLIGRKMGLVHVDIIAELCDRSMLMIIRQICGFLSDADLHR